MTESEALAMANDHLHRQGRTERADSAKYISADEIADKKERYLRKGIDVDAIDIVANPYLRPSPHWSVTYTIDWGRDAVVDPSLGIILVFDDGQVVDFPVM